MAERPPITILLLGDIGGDGRVIKTTRALQDAGYAVTVFCLIRQPPGRVLPDLHGATVRWVTATSPLARTASLAAMVTRRVRRLGVNTARGAGTEPAQDGVAGALGVTTGAGPRCGDRRMRGVAAGALQVLRDLRAFVGTLRLSLALARAAGATPAAAIHANDLDTLPAGALLSRRLGACLVYDAHELYPEMLADRSALYAGLWRLLEHRLIPAVSAVITVNESIAHELQRRHRLPCLPAVVLNCPPRQEQSSGGPGDHRGPVAPPHTTRDLLLLYHGHFHSGRGLETLIEAMTEVAPGATLCLRGAGPLAPALRRLVARLGLERRVRFLDPVPPDQLVTALAGFSVGVVPYLPTSLNNYLCTPNKLFEYLMGGLAVLASDLPELRRVIGDSGAGLLYPATDAHALAAAINALLLDRRALEDHAAAARRAALATYNWERQVEVLRGVYANVLDALPEAPAAQPLPFA